MPVSQTSARSRLQLVGIAPDEIEQVLPSRISSSPSIMMVIGERQLAGHRLPGAAGLHEGHQLAFVVAGPARDDRLASVRQGGDARLEGRRLPQIERIDRLHVVMAVEQHAAARALPSLLPSTTGWPAVSRSSAAKPIPDEIAEPHARRPRGIAACRPDRSRSRRCAADRTADRGSRRDPDRCGRERPRSVLIVCRRRLPSRPRISARPICVPTWPATERATCLTTTSVVVMRLLRRPRGASPPPPPSTLPSTPPSTPPRPPPDFGAGSAGAGSSSSSCGAARSCMRFCNFS